MKKINLSQFIQSISKLINFLKRNQKKSILFFCLVLLGVFLVVQPARADIGDAILKAMAGLFQGFTALALGGVTFCLEFFLNIAKYNGYVEPSTQIVVVGWTLVRDVANMFFVVILLVIAFGTILGVENYQWNKLLGKLIFAAIFINFSKMICGLFIDVAYVFSLTFLNAIVNTAQGNILHAFHMPKLLDFSNSSEVLNNTGITAVNLAVSNFAAFMFAVMLLFTMGAYLGIMLARMVVLWLLIILSPLAFIFQIMPQTQEYAKQWWSRFTKQVLVLPVMTFFLWLTLATSSSGDIANTIGVGFEGTLLETTSLPSSLVEITSFNNMANFLVPFAIMIAGLTIVGQMGVVGGGLASKALDLGKRVGAIASGYALGRKVAGGVVGTVVGGAEKGAKAALVKFPLKLAKSGFMNYAGKPIVRGARRLNELRYTVPVLKHIPILGRAKEEYNEKLDAQLKKTLEANKEVRINALSNENSLGISDKIGKQVMDLTGGRFGWGLKFSSYRKNKAEEELSQSKRQKEGKSEDRKAAGAKRMDENAKKLFDHFEEQERVGFVAWTSQSGNEGKTMDDYIGATGGVGAQDERFRRFMENLQNDKDMFRIDGEDMVDVNGYTLDGAGRLAVANTVRSFYYEQKAETNRTKADEARTDAQAAFAKINFVAKLIRDEGFAKVGTEIGENFVKQIKDQAIKLKWEEAKKKLESIKGLGSEEAKQQELNKALTGNSVEDKFIQALHYKLEADIAEVEAKGARDDANKSLHQIEDEKWVRFYEAKRKIAEAKQEDQYIRDVKAGKKKPKLEEIELEELTEEEKQKYNSIQEKLKSNETLTEEDQKIIEKQKKLEEDKKINVQRKQNYSEEVQRYENAQNATPNNLDNLLNDLYIASVNSGRITEKTIGPMSPQMRKAQAEILSKGAESYFKSVATRLSPQYMDAAEQLAGFRKQLEAASSDDTKKRILDKQRKFLDSNPYAAEIFYEQQVRVAEGEVNRAKSEAAKEIAMTEIGENLIKRLADAEVGSKIAEEFVKGVKNKHLMKEFEKAAEKMKIWASMSMSEAKKKSEEALDNIDENIYIRVLGLTKKVAEEEQITNVRRKQAEDAAYDAFVVKPLYGTTSPSSALSDLIESKLKNYSGLDRAAMVKKANDMQASLNYLKSLGQTLTLQQEAELEAASSVLQKEGWNDDQSGHIFRMFQKLKDGQLEGEEKAKWENMADIYSKLDWISVKRNEDGTMERDKKGNIIFEGEIVKKVNFGRKYAADLQAMNLSGGNVELLQAHNKIAEADTQQAITAEQEAEKAAIKSSKQYIEDLEEKESKRQLQSNSEEARILLEYRKAKQNFTIDNKGLLDDSLLEKMAERVGFEAISDFSEVSEKVKTAVERAVEDHKKGYWEIAQALSDAGELNMTVEEMKREYARLTDFMQNATINNKRNALSTGHTKLGYNQDFDEDVDIYRFQTYREAETKMNNERAKVRTRQLINNEQIHSYGTYNLLHGVLDNFDENAFSVGLGKVNRLLDILDMPSRSKKGLAYLSANEIAQVVKGVEQGHEGKNFAVIGGEDAKKMFRDMGITDVNKQANHMLIHGILTGILGGKDGFSLSLADLFKNVTEQQARNGIVNWKVGKYEFETIEQVADKIIELVSTNEDILNGTANYAGKAEDVIRRLIQVKNKFKVNIIVKQDDNAENSNLEIEMDDHNE